jgi:antitoxin HigA-1
MLMTSKSPITTEESDMEQRLSPVHPGEILAEEFLRPMGISQYRLAKDILVPPRRINEIVKGKRSLTADTALRLSKFFGTSEIFWLNLQARYDLDMQRQRLGKRLRDVRPHHSPSRPLAAYRRKAK